jgi:hypothetical protein
VGHQITAFVGRPETLHAIVGRFPAAKVVELDAGFAMVPATEALLDAIVAADPAGEGLRETGLLFDDPVLVRALIEFSRSGPIALIETHYFGGDGEQAAAACVGGRVVCSKQHSTETDPSGPLYENVNGRFVASKSGESWPINQALREIGVVRAGGQDEFDTVGLVVHRNMGRFE